MAGRNTVQETVEQILANPVFRAGLQSAIVNSQQSGQQNRSEVSVPVIQNTVNNSNVYDELRRIFRPEQQVLCSTSTRVTKKRKNYKTEFFKDVFLLESSEENQTITGKRKADAFLRGFAFSGVKFEKNWSPTEIHNQIRKIFFLKISEETNFEILLPISGALIKPAITELNGSTLNRLFIQKSVYVRPMPTLLEKENEIGIPKHVEDLEPEMVKTNITDITSSSSSINNVDNVIIEIPSLETTSIITDLNLSESSSMINNFNDATTEIPTLEKILNNIANNINKSDVFYVNINRDNILPCIFGFLNKKRFSPWKSLMVTFSDINNVSEGAVDSGGCTREMFRLGMQELKNSNLFAGSENSKNITLFSQELEKNSYFFMGQMIALSLAHGCSGPNFFSITLFNYISKGIDYTYPTINEIEDIDIKNELLAVQESTDLNSLQSLLDESVSLSIAGCFRIVKNINEKDKIVQDAVKFFVLYRPRAALDQFIDGLKLCGIHDAIIKFPHVFEDIFTYKNNSLTALGIDRMFKIEFSEAGSNKRRVENQIVMYWRDYLQDSEDGDTKTTLQNILAFGTGSDTIPPLGFSINPSIKFLHGDTSVYPKGNTCALEIYLPVNHGDYESFKKDLDFGILNGMVFGLY